MERGTTINLSNKRKVYVCNVMHIDLKINKKLYISDLDIFNDPIEFDKFRDCLDQLNFQFEIKGVADKDDIMIKNINEAICYDEPLNGIFEELEEITEEIESMFYQERQNLRYEKTLKQNPKKFSKKLILNKKENNQEKI
ncbi:MAG: hypothetical protein PHQ62_03040 [Clostridia bacterium]|nr:hypothetical protein [Clostridia bacterium]